MKKLCFMLTALLLAVPAADAADVTISCTADGNEVTVSYTASADANKPRAFGLDIELNNSETITSLTLLDPNYWVYPGTIDINESGGIENDGNGIGQQDDAAYPDTLYGLDSNGITIEMGSLHSPPEYDSPNAPDLSSAILKFTVSGDCNVAISGNAARGNVVLYDATAADVDYGSGCTVTLAGAPCPGDVTGTAMGLVTGPPPGNIKTFNSSLWTGPNGTTNITDVQALIYMLKYDGTSMALTPVPAEGAAGDVTATAMGLVTGPPPGNIKTFNKGLWTGPNGTLNITDVQALIYLLKYDGTAMAYTCP